MRVGDPNGLINIAHVVGNKVAPKIDVGTISTLTNYSALSQGTISSQN
jgi:hypothetical protein